jgi:DNA polymerase-3 subunit gamma/tau
MIEATKPYKIDELIKELEKEPLTLVPSKKTNTPKEMFKKLIEKIKERDEDLGICFETSLKFISFENNTLTWESCPDYECKNMFRKYFSSVIRPIINEIFGVGTKIEVIRCPETPTKKNKPQIEPTYTPDESDKLVQKVREVFGTQVEITKLPLPKKNQESN